MLIAQLSFMALDAPAERPYGSEELGSHYQGQVDGDREPLRGGRASAMTDDAARDRSLLARGTLDLARGGRAASKTRSTTRGSRSSTVAWARSAVVRSWIAPTCAFTELRVTRAAREPPRCRRRAAMPVAGADGRPRVRLSLTLASPPR